MQDVANELQTRTLHRCTFLAQHAILGCRAYATGMMSVCPSVTLVDFDHLVQHKVEIGTWQERSAS